MQKIESGNPNCEIRILDEPGKYQVTSVCENDADVAALYAHVGFQDGPVKENGVNGCHQEDLLQIVRHRLQCFQAGQYACRENALALTKIEEAIHWLNHRTADRGTPVK